MSEKKITEWRLDAVFRDIVNTNEKRTDRNYAFILGAGASKSSDIPTGQELARQWLREIHKNECLSNDSLEQWLSSSEHGFDIEFLSMENAGSYYPQIFERRFAGDHDAGYKALEDAMENKIPSLGYSSLASILQKTRHKVVITTNFDNLVADALAMHAHQPPLIVAHESLTGFVRSNLRRPLIAKIHRDLFFSPKNDANGVSIMEKSWKEALEKLFQHYTPIVAGYGGNDGSLMDMLENLSPGAISGRIIWCCRDTQEIPEKVERVLRKHKGVVTKISNFDEFMLELAGKIVPNFDVTLIPKSLTDLGEERAKTYREQIERLQKQSTEEHRTAPQVIIESAKDEEDWWSWQLKINNETDFDKRLELYEKAINKFPNSTELNGNYATFLHHVRKDYNKAKAVYQRTYELNPNSPINNGNYAVFLKDICKDYDKAESLHQKAIELNPDGVAITNNYATFLFTIRKDYDKAESLYQKAIQLDSNNVNILANYSCLLTTRKTAINAKLVNQYTQHIIKTTKPKSTQPLAEALLYTRLAYELFPQTITSNPLPRLKNLINNGFKRESWSFEHIFDVVLPDLIDEKQKFYRALGEAILDEKKVNLLENFTDWKDCEEIDVFADFEDNN